MPAFCSVKSKIRMVALTKPGMTNIVWYSFLSHDDQPPEKIIKSMKRRFEEIPELIAVTQVLMFFDNQSKVKIDEYR